EKTLTSLSGGATVSAKLPKEPRTGAGSSLAGWSFRFVMVSAWAMAHPGHSTCEQAILHLPYPHAESHTVNNVRPLTLEDKTNVQGVTQSNLFHHSTTHPRKYRAER